MIVLLHFKFSFSRITFKYNKELAKLIERTMEKYEIKKNKLRLEKMLRKLTDDINMTEMEWLQLCTISSTLNGGTKVPEVKEDNETIVIRDDDEIINKKVISLDLESNIKEEKSDVCVNNDNEEEEEEEECNSD